MVRNHNSRMGVMLLLFLGTVVLASGCAALFEVRMDVRQGPAAARAVVDVPDVEYLAGPPIENVTVEFWMQQRANRRFDCGTRRTRENGVLVHSIFIEGFILLRPGNTVIHFSCRKEGYSPFQGSFRVGRFPWCLEPDRTVLVIMEPTERLQ